MTEESAKAYVRDALALLTASQDSGSDAVDAALADYTHHMHEMGQMLADMPPGDADLKERFLLILGAMRDSTEAVLGPLRGFVGVTDVLLADLCGLMGKSKPELLQELALRFA